ncbi:MAG: winged helix-turn-helix domain-containing protein [Candidatus Bathyarchaeia archaeon]
MQIEEVLGNRLRIKILKILNQMGELNVSEIARRVGANHAATMKHLKILEGEGILEHKMFGRIRLYRFNMNSVKARAVQNLIEGWEKSENTAKPFGTIK